MPTTATRTCGCRGATARTPSRRDPDCPTHGIDPDKLAEYHATTYTVPVEIRWPDTDGLRHLVVTTETVGCHTRAACWEQHAPGVAAREVAGALATESGLFVGRATMGHVPVDGAVVAGWHVYLTYAPLVDEPEPPRSTCRQCGDVSGRCRHGMRGRYGA